MTQITKDLIGKTIYISTLDGIRFFEQVFEDTIIEVGEDDAGKYVITNAMGCYFYAFEEDKYWSFDKNKLKKGA